MILTFLLIGQVTNLPSQHFLLLLLEVLFLLSSEDSLEYLLYHVFLLLRVYHRCILARALFVASLFLLGVGCALLLLGYASATAIAAWAYIVLGSWALLRVIVVIATLVVIIVAALVVALL